MYKLLNDSGDKYLSFSAICKPDVTSMADRIEYFRKLICSGFVWFVDPSAILRHTESAALII